jgi:ABC-2 type transport system permease protein
MFQMLLWTAWRRHRTLRWSLAIGMFLMALLLAGTYQVFGTGFIPQSMMDSITDMKVFQAFSGSSINFLEPEGWLGFGYVHPITLTLLIAWIVASAAAALAREVEDGTVEFLMSRPVDRRVVLGARYVAWLLGMLTILVAGYVGTLAGIVFFDTLRDFSPGAALLLGASLVPMVVLLGGLAFLVSAAVSSRGRVTGAVVGFTVGSYFLNFAAGLWDPLEAAKPLSLFHYVAPAEWVQSGVDWLPGVLMTVLGLLLLAGGMLVIDRRDIAV